MTIISNPDIAEIAARLGGAGPIDEANLHFNYCDVVAVVQALADQQKIAAQQAGKPERVAAAFVLQESPTADESVFDAPPTERPQTSEPPGKVSSAVPAR